MSSIPHSSLLAKFYELSEDLITDVNATQLILNYLNNSLTGVSTLPSDRPLIIDQLGGRNNLNNLPGHSNGSATGYMVQGTTSETLLARAYWNCSLYDPALRGINIKEIKNICKIITYIGYEQQILNATSATINGKECKLIKPPVPHGMGKYYLECYWEISN